MLLLRLLEEKDMYGYEMIETLESRSNHVSRPKGGYSCILCFIHWRRRDISTSYENEVNGKTRKYYSITKNGRNYLKDKKKEWQEYQTAVTNVLCMEG